MSKHGNTRPADYRPQHRAHNEAHTERRGTGTTAHVLLGALAASVAALGLAAGPATQKHETPVAERPGTAPGASASLTINEAIAEVHAGKRASRAESAPSPKTVAELREAAATSFTGCDITDIADGKMFRGKEGVLDQTRIELTLTPGDAPRYEGVVFGQPQVSVWEVRTAVHNGSQQYELGDRLGSAVGTRANEWGQFQADVYTPHKEPENGDGRLTAAYVTVPFAVKPPGDKPRLNVALTYYCGNMTVHWKGEAQPPYTQYAGVDEGVAALPLPTQEAAVLAAR